MEVIRMQLKRLFAVATAALLLFAIVALAAPDNATYTGWVMDKKCAAKGKANTADCAKKCIAAGSPMVLLNDADKSLLTIANPKALEDHIGHHVKVQGTLSGEKLTVTNAEMLPDQDMK